MKICFNEGKYYFRQVYDNENRLIENEIYTKDMDTIYLGKVVKYSNSIGYMVDIGSGYGLYNSKDVEIGKTYLFRVNKIIKGKDPILTRDIVIFDSYFVYPSDKYNNPKYRGAYLRKETEEDLTDRYNKLVKKYDEIIRVGKYDLKPKLVYSPIREEEFDPYLKMSYLKRIEYYKNREVLVDDFLMHLSITPLGLVVDVDRFKSSKSDEEINKMALEKLSEILIYLNIGGIVICDLIADADSLRNSFSLKDNRIKYFSISPNGIVEINRQYKGIDLLKV